MKNQGVKVEIPRELYQAVVRIQAEGSLHWSGACLRLALVADQRAKEYDCAVRREALRMAKSEMMATLNKSRETIARKWFLTGEKYVRQNESRFWVRCAEPTCRVLLCLSSTQSNWPEVQEILDESFADWRHVNH